MAKERRLVVRNERTDVSTASDSEGKDKSSQAFIREPRGLIGTVQITVADVQELGGKRPSELLSLRQLFVAAKVKGHAQYACTFPTTIRRSTKTASCTWLQNLELPIYLPGAELASLSDLFSTIEFVLCQSSKGRLKDGHQEDDQDGDETDVARGEGLDCKLASANLSLSSLFSLSTSQQPSTPENSGGEAQKGVKQQEKKERRRTKGAKTEAKELAVEKTGDIEYSLYQKKEHSVLLTHVEHWSPFGKLRVELTLLPEPPCPPFVSLSSLSRAFSVTSSSFGIQKTTILFHLPYMILSSEGEVISAAQSSPIKALKKELPRNELRRKETKLPQWKELKLKELQRHYVFIARIHVTLQQDNGGADGDLSLGSYSNTWHARSLDIKSTENGDAVIIWNSVHPISFDVIPKVKGRSRKGQNPPKSSLMAEITLMKVRKTHFGLLGEEESREMELLSTSGLTVDLAELLRNGVQTECGGSYFSFPVNPFGSNTTPAAVKRSSPVPSISSSFFSTATLCLACSLSQSANFTSKSQRSNAEGHSQSSAPPVLSGRLHVVVKKAVGLGYNVRPQTLSPFVGISLTSALVGEGKENDSSVDQRQIDVSEEIASREEEVFTHPWKGGGRIVTWNSHLILSVSQFSPVAFHSSGFKTLPDTTKLENNVSKRKEAEKIVFTIYDEPTGSLTDVREQRKTGASIDQIIGVGHMEWKELLEKNSGTQSVCALEKWISIDMLSEGEGEVADLQEADREEPLALDTSMGDVTKQRKRPRVLLQVSMCYIPGEVEKSLSEESIKALLRIPVNQTFERGMARVNVDMLRKELAEERKEHLAQLKFSEETKETPETKGGKEEQEEEKHTEKIQRYIEGKEAAKKEGVREIVNHERDLEGAYKDTGKMLSSVRALLSECADRIAKAHVEIQLEDSKSVIDRVLGKQSTDNQRQSLIATKEGRRKITELLESTDWEKQKSVWEITMGMIEIEAQRLENNLATGAKILSSRLDMSPVFLKRQLELQQRLSQLIEAQEKQLERAQHRVLSAFETLSLPSIFSMDLQSESGQKRGGKENSYTSHNEEESITIIRKQKVFDELCALSKKLRELKRKFTAACERGEELFGGEQQEEEETQRGSANALSVVEKRSQQEEGEAKETLVRELVSNTQQRAQKRAEELIYALDAFKSRRSAQHPEFVSFIQRYITTELWKFGNNSYPQDKSSLLHESIKDGSPPVEGEGKQLICAEIREYLRGIDSLSPLEEVLRLHDLFRSLEKPSQGLSFMSTDENQSKSPKKKTEMGQTGTKLVHSTLKKSEDSDQTARLLQQRRWEEMRVKALELQALKPETFPSTLQSLLLSPASLLSTFLSSKCLNAPVDALFLRVFTTFASTMTEEAAGEVFESLLPISTGEFSQEVAKGHLSEQALISQYIRFGAVAPLSAKGILMAILRRHKDKLPKETTNTEPSGPPPSDALKVSPDSNEARDKGLRQLPIDPKLKHLPSEVGRILSAPSLEIVKKYLKDCPYLWTAHLGTHGKTLLHYAAQFHRKDLVAFLLRKGAARNAKDFKGREPKEFARTIEILQMLSAVAMTFGTPHVSAGSHPSAVQEKRLMRTLCWAVKLTLSANKTSQDVNAGQQSTPRLRFVSSSWPDEDAAEQSQKAEKKEGEGEEKSYALEGIVRSADLRRRTVAVEVLSLDLDLSAQDQDFSVDWTVRVKPLLERSQVKELKPIVHSSSSSSHKGTLFNPRKRWLWLATETSEGRDKNGQEIQTTDETKKPKRRVIFPSREIFLQLPARFLGLHHELSSGDRDLFAFLLHSTSPSPSTPIVAAHSASPSANGLDTTLEEKSANSEQKQETPLLAFTELLLYGAHYRSQKDSIKEKEGLAEKPTSAFKDMEQRGEDKFSFAQLLVTGPDFGKEVVKGGQIKKEEDKERPERHTEKTPEHTVSSSYSSPCESGFYFARLLTLGPTMDRHFIESHSGDDNNVVKQKETLVNGPIASPTRPEGSVPRNKQTEGYNTAFSRLLLTGQHFEVVASSQATRDNKESQDTEVETGRESPGRKGLMSGRAEEDDNHLRPVKAGKSRTIREHMETKGNQEGKKGFFFEEERRRDARDVARHNLEQFLSNLDLPETYAKELRAFEMEAAAMAEEDDGHKNAKRTPNVAENNPGKADTVVSGASLLQKSAKEALERLQRLL